MQTNSRPQNRACRESNNIQSIASGLGSFALDVCDIARQMPEQRNGETTEPTEAVIREQLVAIFDLAPSTEDEAHFAADFDHFASKRIKYPRSQLLTRLRRAAQAKRPLSSSFCEGMTRTLIANALRTYESRWLKAKQIERFDPVGQLVDPSRRLKPEDHERIRGVILDRLIPSLEQQPKTAPHINADQQTQFLALADLYCEYAPPKDFDEAGVINLPVCRETLFIKFMEAAFRFF